MENRIACTTVGSHKRPVVHCQTNGQREKYYNLVIGGLCLYVPCLLLSNEGFTPRRQNNGLSSVLTNFCQHASF